jgi:hypothetical protein
MGRGALRPAGRRPVSGLLHESSGSAAAKWRRQAVSASAARSSGSSRLRVGSLRLVRLPADRGRRNEAWKAGETGGAERNVVPVGRGRADAANIPTLPSQRLSWTEPINSPVIYLRGQPGVKGGTRRPSRLAGEQARGISRRSGTAGRWRRAVEPPHPWRKRSPPPPKPARQCRCRDRSRRPRRRARGCNSRSPCRRPRSPR